VRTGAHLRGEGNAVRGALLRLGCSDSLEGDPRPILASRWRQDSKDSLWEEICASANVK
jgi:hypothetical protein